MDVQLSKTFFDRLTLRLAASDVLNAPVRWVHIYTDRPDRDAFDPRRDQYIRRTVLGFGANFTV
ncbi:MAG: hypothetical protein RMM53_07625, partial [Bacteroidia bacterium]|nr:hypothetical protein [Bacteroidia bacterium]